MVARALEADREAVHEAGQHKLTCCLKTPIRLLMALPALALPPSLRRQRRRFKGEIVSDNTATDVLEVQQPLQKLCWSVAVPLLAPHLLHAA